MNFYHKNTFTKVLIIQVNFISDYQSSKSESEGPEEVQPALDQTPTPIRLAMFVVREFLS